MKTKLITSLLLATALLQVNATPSKDNNVDSLKLYSEVTSLTMAFNEKYGQPFRLPVNARDSINAIVKNSNTADYMGTKTYNDYNNKSEFSKQSHAMMSDLTYLISQFKKIGFIQAIESQGKTPALMFDIDNTIELTSFDDDYFTKSGINDPATSDFIKSVCFKNGIACYFITARTCNHNEAIATKSWLQKHLRLSNKEINNYVFLSGSIPSNACTSNPNESIAYKDILRHALSDTKNVYWLMSIGDQMTDWFGKNSGLKVWYPNEMFDSSIVANDHNNPKIQGQLRTVIAPTQQCYSKLKGEALKSSTIQYCEAFKTDKYI